MSVFESLVGDGVPLTQEQLQALHRLARTLDDAQLTWASGYLAGLARPAASAHSAPAPQGQTVVLFASQSGNARKVAQQLHGALADADVAADLRDVRTFKVNRLKRVERVFLVAATHGEGEPPDTAQIFYRDLMSDKAPRLERLEFAVLSLGDSGYEHFCQMGKDFDGRFEALGATRIFDRVDCDLDYEANAAQWVKRVVNTLAEQTPLKAGGERGAPVLRLASSRSEAQRASFSGASPYLAEIALNQKITGRDSTKDVRHIELAIDDDALPYTPGDALAVLAQNDEALVGELLNALELDGEARVLNGSGETSLAEALRRHTEITAVTRPFLERYARLAEAPSLERLLVEDARSELKDLMDGRDVLDIVRRWPVKGIEAQRFVDTLRKLPPRSYSIASSQEANPGEVHLTVGVVRYTSHGRARKGVASNHLAALEAGETVGVFVEPNENFRLAAPDRRIIMIGAGTGIAPYRAFLEAREIAGATGEAWLLFGDRHFRSDFLYQQELLEYRSRGQLARVDVAFSRDQAHKVYVQHRLLAHGREIYRWLEEGAHLYVCGDAKRMAPDVHEALVSVVAQARGAEREAAIEYLQDLVTQGRYQRDVY